MPYERQLRLLRRLTNYTIETSHNDELFIINGEKYEAKTYCFNMEEDDEVNELARKEIFADSLHERPKGNTRRGAAS